MLTSTHTWTISYLLNVKITLQLKTTGKQRNGEDREPDRPVDESQGDQSM